MTSATMLTPLAVAEEEVAQVLEQQFDAAWFPQYHRCSIDTEDGFVAVDFDPEYFVRLAPDEQAALTGKLGFAPRAALHVQSSIYHPGSAALAERVFQALSRRFQGRELAAA